jgi:hypothetical protein
MNKERLGIILEEYDTVKDLATDVDDLLINLKTVCESSELSDQEKIEQIKSTITCVLIG